MIIQKHIGPFLVYREESILHALQKISANKRQILFAVNEKGQLEGVMTDGDFRRWLVNQTDIDLNQSVSTVLNRDCLYLHHSVSPEKLSTQFSNRIREIPLVDDQQHILAIASSISRTIAIGDFQIDEDSEAFLIAEIGNNHNGQLDHARYLIEKAAEAGANCAKFQMRQLPSLYGHAGNPADVREDLGSQYTLGLLKRFSLSNDDLFRAFDHCHRNGIVPLCTAWDLESVGLLERYGIAAYKVASADLTYSELLNAIIATNKPLIVSTGMSRESEIQQCVSQLKTGGTPFVLLHCNSTYPTPFKDVNLKYLQRLKEIGDCPVGYSGHERDINISIAAVTLGAKVVEKHFTSDTELEGNDHRISLLPGQFRRMVSGIRQVEEALGSASERTLSQGETMNREVLAKSLVATRNIDLGETITDALVTIRSPGKGIQPNKRADLIGRKATRHIAAHDFFYQSDIDGDAMSARPYSFSRPWGIPARYHDLDTLVTASNPDLVEIHFSFNDLEVDFAPFLKGPYELGLVIHSPELFSGDHVLDLCADDEAYRLHSIKELQRVIHITRTLTPYFRQTALTPIVVNVGGFSLNGHLPDTARSDLIARLRDSLAKLDTKGVELIPQTMPPLPWHFGGQRYHNLFVDSDSILAFCSETGFRVCLDVSHTKLACNYYKWSFAEFIRRIAPCVAHMHLADAIGVDGEGLQIGDGDLDFQALLTLLDQLLPDTGFIPEIWQGHKNNGEGFWIGLDRLESLWRKNSDRDTQVVGY